jgi:hypothetical protein
MNQEIQTQKQLVELITGNNDNGVYAIKPRIFLQAMEKRESPISRGFSLIFPPVSIGSPSIFEVSMISLIVKLLMPRKIVEIGTYTGYTTAILAKNSHDKAIIVSIDLPTGDYLDQNNAISNEALLSNWVVNDNFLRQRQSDAGELYINGLPSSYSDKIRLIKADSTKMTAEDIAHLAQAELFFIDGGHSFETVRSDTSLALASIVSSGLVLWHDYGSSIHSEVTQYIDKSLSSEHKILHIRGTSLALLINSSEALERLVG